MQVPFDRIPVSTKSAEAARHYGEALRCYVSYSGDLLGSCQAALKADPDFVIPNVLLVIVFAFSNLEPTLEPTKSALDALKNAETATNLSERERQLVLVAKHLAAGRYLQASLVLEPLVFQNPNDMLAEKSLSDIYFFIGQSERQASHVDIKRWREIVATSAGDENLRLCLGFVLGTGPERTDSSRGIDSHSIGNRAFGLMEIGQTEDGDAAARESLQINPGDIWSIHARCHYFEMTKDYTTAIEWLNSVKSRWEIQGGALLTHMYWHLALFHLGRGEFDTAREIFEVKVLTNANMAAIDLVDASTLLWRLELGGRTVQAAWWDEISAQWLKSIPLTAPLPPTTIPMNLTHLALAVVKSSRAADRLALNSMMNQLKEIEEGAVGQYLVMQSYLEKMSAITRELCDGLIAFAQGDNRKCVETLNPIRGFLLGTGGSIPQRAIYFQILGEAKKRV